MQKSKIMDLATRKYNFIQKLINVDKESVIDALERVLKRENEENMEISEVHKKELNKRLESYKNNPQDILDWENIKNDW